MNVNVCLFEYIRIRVGVVVTKLNSKLHRRTRVMAVPRSTGLTTVLSIVPLFASELRVQGDAPVPTLYTSVE